MRVLQEPSHEPVAFSDESFPASRRWIVFALLVMLTILAGVVSAVLLV